MTPADEYVLYHTDRDAWIALVAERTAQRFAVMPDREIADSWPLLGRDFQIAIWAHLSKAERERIRSARHEVGIDA
jgi:hypothetical protein